MRLGLLGPSRSRLRTLGSRLSACRPGGCLGHRPGLRLSLGSGARGPLRHRPCLGRPLTLRGSLLGRSLRRARDPAYRGRCSACAGHACHPGRLGQRLGLRICTKVRADERRGHGRHVFHRVHEAALFFLLLLRTRVLRDVHDGLSGVLGRVHGIETSAGHGLDHLGHVLEIVVLVVLEDVQELELELLRLARGHPAPLLVALHLLAAKLDLLVEAPALLVELGLVLLFLELDGVVGPAPLFLTLVLDPAPLIESLGLAPLLILRLELLTLLLLVVAPAVFLSLEPLALLLLLDPELLAVILLLGHQGHHRLDGVLLFLVGVGLDHLLEEHLGPALLGGRLELDDLLHQAPVLVLALLDQALEAIIGRLGLGGGLGIPLGLGLHLGHLLDQPPVLLRRLLDHALEPIIRFRLLHLADKPLDLGHLGLELRVQDLLLDRSRLAREARLGRRLFFLGVVHEHFPHEEIIHTAGRRRVFH